MQLADDTIQFLDEFVAQINRRKQAASYLDLIGQNDNSVTPPAGKIGEYISSSVASGSAVALSNNVAADITSISLTPGDWDVWLNGYFTGNAATAVNYLQVSISNTSATIDSSNGRFGTESTQGATIFAGGAMQSVDAGAARVTLAVTTPIYAVALAGFSVNTCSGYGILQARRRRFFPG